MQFYMFLIAALVELVLFTADTAAQSVYPEWIRHYNGAANASDGVTCSALDESGNFFVCGHTYGVGTGSDVTTIKYDTRGNIVWESTYNYTSSSTENPYFISIDKSGNVYVTGESGNVMFTIKYDSTGNQKWVNRFVVINTFSYGVSAIPDNEGNVYVLGSAISTTNDEGMVLIKLDSTGAELWRRWNNGFGEANVLAMDSSGFLYAAGSMYYDGYWDDISLIKYNASGDSLWSRRYNSSQYDHVTAICMDDSGNVYLTGECDGNPFNWYNYKYITLKYNQAGNLKWAKKYNGFGNDRDFAFAITCDKAGNVYVTGESSGPSGSFDYATIKYNSNGDSVWVRRYNGSIFGDDIAVSIDSDSRCNVYVTGSSITLNNTKDIVTIKYDSAGNLIWTIKYDNNNGNDEAAEVVADKTGSIYVSGSSSNLKTGNDFCTIKYSDFTGITNYVTGSAGDFVLYQNSPNPFNSSTEIKFRTVFKHFVTIDVVDNCGRRICYLTNAELEAGEHKISFDAKRLSTGIYFCRMQIGKFSQIRKMLLIK